MKRVSHEKRVSATFLLLDIKIRLQHCQLLKKVIFFYGFSVICKGGLQFEKGGLWALLLLLAFATEPTTSKP